MLRTDELRFLTEKINWVYAEANMALRVAKYNAIVETPLGVFFRMEFGRPISYDRNGHQSVGKRPSISEARSSKMQVQLNSYVGQTYREIASARQSGRNLGEMLVSFIDSPFCVVLPTLDELPKVFWEPQQVTARGQYILGYAYPYDAVKPVIWNQLEKSHLLVAGASGQGKTTMLAQVACSFLWDYNPSELEMVVIDPKGRALTKFCQMPHVRLPAAVAPEECNTAVTAIWMELQRRIQQPPTRKLLVLADELTSLVEENKDNQQMLFEIARTGRELGIYLVVGIHKPLADLVGELRSQFLQRVVMRMQGARDLQTVTNMSLEAARLSQRGICYVTDGHSAQLTQATILGSIGFQMTAAKYANHTPPMLNHSVLQPHITRISKGATTTQQSGYVQPQAPNGTSAVESLGSAPDLQPDIEVPMHIRDNRKSVRAETEEAERMEADRIKLIEAFGLDSLITDNPKKKVSQRKMMLALGYPVEGTPYYNSKRKLSAVLESIGIES